ncbi:MAG: ester cyclase, partial [Bacteroidota bacterium]
IIFIFFVMATIHSSQVRSQAPQVQLEDHIQEHWTPKEVQNATIVINFIQQLMNAHDFEFIESAFGTHPYHQHNRSMKDGIPGVLEAVRDLVKSFPDYCYDVKRILVSGDHVVFHSHVTVKSKHRGNDKKGFIISDTWRLEKGKIVEHWDAIQPLNGFFRFYTWLTGGKIRNSNGLF